MTDLSFTVRPLAEVLDESDLSGHGSLVDQVYDLLRRRIIDLSLPPELMLVEQEAARALSVSKTPVREAIIRLSRDGLVRVVPQSGSYVTAISLDRYIEACFIRTQLEVGCVKRLAAQGVGLAEQVTLKALLTEQKTAIELGDETSFFELDEALHKRFFELAGLRGVWNILQQTKAELDRVRHLKRMFGIRQQQAVLDEHTGLVDAILDRDTERAEQLILENIGSIVDQAFAIAENPNLLRTIDDLNKLVALDRRQRGKSKQNAA